MAIKPTITLPPIPTTKFPTLRSPDAAISAPVKVRMGDTLISAVYPPRS